MEQKQTPEQAARQQVDEYTRAVLAYDKLIREHLSARPPGSWHVGTVAACPRCDAARTLLLNLEDELIGALMGEDQP